jgi:DNA-binding transcriptional LysR family regulator
MTQSLRTKNLNLVPILQALLHHASVVKAAEELHLTQPTVSGALARLREIYDDPILIRVGRSSQLSPKAVKLKEKVDEACLYLEGLFQAEEFDPKTVEQHFWVAAPDYLVLLICRELLGKLNSEAPDIKVHFLNVPVDLPAKLNDRSIDLAVCADFQLWPGLNREFLFKDRTLAVVAKGHPLLDKSPVDADDLLEYPCSYYEPSFSSSISKLYSPPTTTVPLMDWNPRMQISTAQVVDQLFIASETDSVVRSPLSMFNYMQKRLRLVSVPMFDQDTSFDTAMFWSAEQGESDAQIWLRETIKDALDSCLYIDR